MGRKKLYMIHTMTDETYAVNCTIEDKRDVSRCILQQMLLDVWSCDGRFDRAIDSI